MESEKIKFMTEDKVRIAGLLWRPNTPINALTGAVSNQKAVLLLHMMPATKESWNAFGQALSNNNFAALAIDLRGHGESTEQKTDNAAIRLDYKNFSDIQHQATQKDIDAAIRFLNGLGYKNSDIYIGGASIGANFAIQNLEHVKEIAKTFAMSPGIEYKGIRTDTLVKNLKNTEQNKKLFLIASIEDEYSAESSKALKKIAPEKINLKIYSDNSGHGTKMFEQHPELMNEIIGWFGE